MSYISLKTIDTTLIESNAYELIYKFTGHL